MFLHEFYDEFKKECYQTQDLDGKIRLLLEDLRREGYVNNRDHVQSLLRLTCAYEVKSSRTGSLDDYRTYVTSLGQSVTSMPDDSQEKVDWLQVWATRLFRLSKRTFLPADNEEGLRVLRLALIKARENDKALEAEIYFQLACYFEDELRDGHIATRNRITTMTEKYQCLKWYVILTPKSHPDWPDRCQTLAVAAHYIAEETNDPRDIRIAVGHWESWLATDPTGRFDTSVPGTKASVLQYLGFFHVSLYHDSGDKAELEKSIQRFEESVLSQPPNMARLKYEQGKAYVALSKITTEEQEKMTLLLRGAEQIRDAMHLIPKAESVRKDMVPGAADIWVEVFDATQRLDHLDTAANLLQDQLSSLPDIFSRRRDILVRLSRLFLHRCMETEQERDILASEHIFQLLLGKMPLDDPERQYIEECAQSVKEFMVKFSSPTEVEATANQGIDAFALEELTSSIDDDIDLSTLGKAFHNPSEDTIQKAEDDLKATPLKSPLRGTKLLAVGAACATWHDTTKSIQHLDKAIQYYRQGLQLEKSGQTLSLLLKGLGAALFSRFEATGDDVALNDAIEVTGRSLASHTNLLEQLSRIETGEIPESVQFFVRNSDLRGGLNLQGRALRKRYERFGHVEDLDSYNRRCQQVLALTPRLDGERPGALFGVGLGLFLKAERDFALPDMLVAVDHLKQAVELSSQGSPGADGSSYQHLLGQAYLWLFRRTSDKSRLELAIQALKNSVTASEGKPEVQAHCLASQGESYLARYDQNDDTDESDVDNAICVYTRAMSLENVSEMAQARVKSGLGIALLRLYVLEDDPESPSWTQGMRYIHDSLKSQIGSSQEQIERYWEMGKGHLLKFGKTGNVECLIKGSIAYQVALSWKRFPPWTRMLIGKELFYIRTEMKDWANAYKTAVEVMDLIPLVLSRSLNNLDKQWLLSHFMGFASDAGAVAIRSREQQHAINGQYALEFEALELIEIGRGVITGSLLGLRSDVDKLKQQHPEIAERYLKFRDSVDHVQQGPGQVQPEPWFPINQPESRFQFNEELDRIINAIRDLEGFESFLKAPSRDEFKAVSRHKTVVVINVSKYGCDAIILRPRGVSIRPLPNLTHADVEKRSNATTSIYSVKHEMLQWLWTTIAEPVLDELGIKTTPSSDHDKWPEICWIPTGQLVGLPLHAAGRHGPSSLDTVMDRVISSYSVSVALVYQMHIYRQEPMANRQLKHAVLVAMEELANAPDEVESVRAVIQTLDVQMPESPSRAIISESLRDCDVFHFAGHGQSDMLNPLNSALLLQNKERITVSDLLELNLHKRRPFLAFLSACSTGQIRQQDSVDEGLHIIAACQVAGFQHVIGTLWEVDDFMCVRAARMTYEKMQDKNMAHESVAQALHQTSRELRNEWVKNCVDAGFMRGPLRPFINPDIEGHLPLLWAPYVHYGL